MNITIEGAGPIARPVTVPNSDRVTIQGPSQSGKSSTLHAIALLWCDSDATAAPYAAEMVGPCGKVTVSVEVDGEMVPACTRSLSGGRSRYIDPTEDAGLSRALAKAIVSPSHWIDLMHGPGNGRKLRELLDANLPGDSAADIIAKFAEGSEPADAKKAEARRRAMNADADTESGRVSMAASSLVGAVEALEAEPAPTNADALEIAKGIIESDDAHSLKVTAHARAARDHNAAKEAEKAYFGRSPIAPDVDKPKGSLEGLDLEDEPTAPGSVPVSVLDAAASISAEAKALTAPMAPVLPEVPVAPTCAGLNGCALVSGRDAIVKVRTDMKAKHDRDLAAHAVKLQALRDAWRSASVTAKEAATVHEGEHAAWFKACGVVRERNDAAIADHAKASEAIRAWESYDAQMSAHGEAPTVPAKPGEVSAAPHTAEAVEAARTLLANAVHSGGRVALEASVKRARDHVDAAREKMKAAQGRAKRAGELLDRIRTAPGEALRGRVGLLNLPDGMVVNVGDDDITVTCDGRPWRVASTGRRIWASAHFRAALRAAVAGASLVPVLIDEGQSWSGGFDDVPGPVVVCVTTVGGDLEIS